MAVIQGTQRGWFPIVVAPRTPPEIVAKLSYAVAEILALPDVAECTISPSLPSERRRSKRQLA